MVQIFIHLNILLTTLQKTFMNALLTVIAVKTKKQFRINTILNASLSNLILRALGVNTWLYNI